MWTVDGEAICDTVGDQESPDVTSDALGGAIVTWHDPRNGNTDIYVQRLNGLGTPQWDSNGVAWLTDSREQSYPRITSAGSGGAFVAEVDMKTTINSIINFIYFKPVSVKEITMLRYFIEPAVARIAASKRTENDIENLREVIGEAVANRQSEISREIGFHQYLARMSGNTLLILLVDFVDNLLSTMKARLDLGPEFYLNVRKAHEIILECLIQAREYQEHGFKQANKFFQKAPSHLKTKSARRLWRLAKKIELNEWWQKLSEFKR